MFTNRLSIISNENWIRLAFNRLVLLGFLGSDFLITIALHQAFRHWHCCRVYFTFLKFLSELRMAPRAKSNANVFNFILDLNADFGEYFPLIDAQARRVFNFHLAVH